MLEVKIIHIKIVAIVFRLARHLCSSTPLVSNNDSIHGQTFNIIKGAVPLETAALNRRWRSYAMYLFLVVCSMYAYFVLGASPQLNNAVFLILVFVFHFFEYFYIYFFVSYLKEKTRCYVFLDVECTPCTKYEFILVIQYF